LKSLDNSNPRKIIAAIRYSDKLLERLGDNGRSGSVKGRWKLSVKLVRYVINYRVEDGVCAIATVCHKA
jgi:hypothetical protein